MSSRLSSPRGNETRLRAVARRSSPALALPALLGAFALTAQESASPVECDDEWRGWRRDRASVCEIREITLPADGSVEVDAGPNGGVDVVGSERSDVLVRARVLAWGDDEAEARDIASRVEILTDGAIRAEGPAQSRRGSWVVSFEISAPSRTDLSIETQNGGIAIRDVNGAIDFTAVNGGARLDGIGGDVHGRTTNGGLRITLAGDTWEGEGLDVQATNGGIRLQVPERYSARLEAGTVNGGVGIDFPVTVQGRIGRNISTTLGEGGPLLQVRTVNGGITIDSY